MQEQIYNFISYLTTKIKKIFNGIRTMIIQVASRFISGMFYISRKIVLLILLNKYPDKYISNTRFVI